QRLVASFTSVLPPGPLHIVALVITVGVTWIVVSILLSGLGFPRIQHLFTSDGVQLFATPWTVAYQAPLSLGFSRQEYWSGLPFPSPGDLPDPGFETASPVLQELVCKLVCKSLTSFT
uniref:Uncharacterized protein n=1 Tax=Bos indicus x Bos taurus TaxID=30522 RepID=A0A4W2FI99_BOBOX